MRQLKQFFKKSPFLPATIFGVFVIIALVLIVRAVSGNSEKATVRLTDNGKVQIQKPLATQEINKEFNFPLKDASGKEVSKLSYVIQKASLQNQIIVKGQRASTVDGRTFLIINMKITNDYNKNITMNVRDYVRLTVNNSTEKLAPEIHNDPVEIQGISTKYTRVGFVIDETDSNLSLQVGELNGPKESIKLSVK